MSEDRETSEISSPDLEREMLRHTVATLAYRARKAISDVPETFADFRAGGSARTPVQILAHIGDLLDWVLSCAKGKQVWNEATPRVWPDEVARFYQGLADLDRFLASGDPLGYRPGRLFQGAIADALTHVGQINLLRRLAGCPIKGENYFKAQIAIGIVKPG